MALVFSVTHTVTFGTDAGEDYQWELDLLRSYDDSESVPSWVSDATVQVTATNSPIEVEWMSDSEVYKPIMASKAKVGLHKIIGDNLPRFTSAGQFEYQVRLRYRRNGESTLNDYWCGFIQSSDGSEEISSISPTLEFTATDNLGTMEDSTVTVGLDSLTPINLFDKVLEAIRQTGLDLPVLVESGIRNTTGDALINVTAHPYSLFTSTDDNPIYRTKLTNKNVIEGLLSAFNCRIFQSYGKWFIVNASTHGGSGANETCTFAKYTVSGTQYVSNGTEDVDLIYSVGGSNPQMIIANSDLMLSTKRPFGSVECKPQNTKEKNYMANGLLQSGVQGFTKEPTSIDQTLNRVELGGNTKHPSATHALKTDRNRFYLNDLSTVWFKSEEMNVDVNAPIDVSFDFLLTDKNESASINYCAVLKTDNVIATSYGFNNNPYSWYTTQQERYFTYNFDRGDWQAGVSILSDYKKAASKTAQQGRGTSSELNEWQTVSEQFNAGSYYDAGTNGFNTLDGVLTIYWFYPQSKRSGRSRWEGSDTNRCEMLVTNVSVKNKYSNNITKATFERVQADYTKTHTYKPYFSDNLPSSVYNRFEEEGFWRKDDLVPLPLTLERIVTQQKLNDNRDEFRYYEGNFINISSDPIAPHHKLNMDWNSYTEYETLIFKGGTYQPKDGVFDMSHYAPNQSTDIAPGEGSVNADGTVTPGFFEYDVDLVADDFSGRSNTVTYSLAIAVEGLDDFGNLLTTNPFSVDEVDNGVLVVQGQPGAKSSHVVKINVDPSFEASASNMSFFDGTNQGTGIWQLLEEGEDTAEQISNVQFRDLGSELEILFDLVLPNLSEFEQIRCAGEVDPLLASNREVDVTFSLAGSYGGSIVNPTRNLRGIPGTNAFINCIITPDDGKEFDASAFSATVPSYMTVNSVEQLGTSVYIEFEVLFQDTNETASVTISGSSSTVLPSGDLSTVTLTLSESISNVSLSRTSLTVTGVVGTTAIYDVTVYAADGFELNAGNFSITEAESWLNMSNATGGGETVLIPLEITFPAADATGTATIAGSAQASGADTVSITLNFTNNISGSSLTDSSEVFILNPGQRISYTNTITPSRGTFLDASGVSVSESSGVVAFTATDAGGGSVNISTSIIAPASNTTIPITLSGSTANEPFVATINLSETLPQGRVTQNTLSQRFGASDTNVIFNVTVSPNEGLTEYASGTTFTISGGVASSYTYANGEVSFVLTVPLPVFNTSSNLIGDVAIGVSITAANPPEFIGDYGITPATTIASYGNYDIFAQTMSAFIPILTTPEPGRFTASGTGVTYNSNGVTITTTVSAGSVNGVPEFFMNDLTATIVHMDDASVTTTVKASKAINSSNAQTVNNVSFVVSSTAPTNNNAQVITFVT